MRSFFFFFFRRRRKGPPLLSPLFFSLVGKQKLFLPLRKLLGELAHGLERLDVGLGCFVVVFEGRVFGPREKKASRAKEKRKSASAEEKVNQRSKPAIRLSFSTGIGDYLPLSAPSLPASSASRTHHNQGGGKRRSRRAKDGIITKIKDSVSQPRGRGEKSER